MSILLTLGVPLAVLVGLVLWARRRTRAFREAARKRENDALQAMLDGVRQQKAEAQQSTAAGAAPNASGAAAVPGSAAALAVVDAPLPSRPTPAATLAPLDFRGGLAPSAVPPPAEPPMVDLDPIEDLISRIVVDAPAAPHAGVALPELALAWYEARGYRMTPTSAAEWPVQGVLRHRDDQARSYAFVVQGDYVSIDRITALAERAREVGIRRVALVATGGYETGAKEAARQRHVRLIDQPTMDAELGGLKSDTVQRIVALARSRSGERQAA